MIERRFITDDTQIETRAETDESGKRYVMGYFALKQSNSVRLTERINGELRTFTERIAPEAFEGVNYDDVIYTVEHDFNRPIARGNALKLSFNDKGLFARAEIPAESDATTIQNDLIKNINQGIIRGNSFAFKVEKDSWYTRGGELFRDINKISKIVDITSTISPAYPDTYVFNRSLNESEIIDEVEVSNLVEGGLTGEPLGESGNEVIAERTEPEPVAVATHDSTTVDLDFEFSLLKKKHI